MKYDMEWNRGSQLETVVGTVNIKDCLTSLILPTAIIATSRDFYTMLFITFKKSFSLCSILRLYLEQNAQMDKCECLCIQSRIC